MSRPIDDRFRAELQGFLGKGFARLSRENKDELLTRYKKTRKNEAIYVWWFFNCHYAYVGRWWLFSLVFIIFGVLAAFLVLATPDTQTITLLFKITFIGVAGWWVIDFFRLMTILKRYNAKKAHVLLDALIQTDIKV